jgi:hypothetical protein
MNTPAQMTATSAMNGSPGFTPAGSQRRRRQRTRGPRGCGRAARRFAASTPAGMMAPPAQRVLLARGGRGDRQGRSQRHRRAPRVHESPGGHGRPGCHAARRRPGIRPARWDPRNRSAPARRMAPQGRESRALPRSPAVPDLPGHPAAPVRQEALQAPVVRCRSRPSNRWRPPASRRGRSRASRASPYGPRSRATSVRQSSNWALVSSQM